MNVCVRVTMKIIKCGSSCFVKQRSGRFFCSTCAAQASAQLCNAHVFILSVFLGLFFFLKMMFRSSVNISIMPGDVTSPGEGGLIMTLQRKKLMKSPHQDPGGRWRHVARIWVPILGDRQLSLWEQSTFGSYSFNSCAELSSWHKRDEGN